MIGRRASHYSIDDAKKLATESESDRKFSPVRAGHCRRPDQKLMESFCVTETRIGRMAQLEGGRGGWFTASEGFCDWVVCQALCPVLAALRQARIYDLRLAIGQSSTAHRQWLRAERSGSSTGANRDNRDEDQFLCSLRFLLFTFSLSRRPTPADVSIDITFPLPSALTERLCPRDQRSPQTGWWPDRGNQG